MTLQHLRDASERAADRLDSVLMTLSLPIDAETHVEGCKEVLRQIRDELRGNVGATPTFPDEVAVERAARAIHADLFSDDAETAHRAASPIRLDIARDEVRAKVRAVLTAAFQVQTGGDDGR